MQNKWILTTLLKQPCQLQTLNARWTVLQMQWLAICYCPMEVCWTSAFALLDLCSSINIEWSVIWLVQIVNRCRTSIVFANAQTLLICSLMNLVLARVPWIRASKVFYKYASATNSSMLSSTVRWFVPDSFALPIPRQSGFPLSANVRVGTTRCLPSHWCALKLVPRQLPK